jgi:hypothetical protein
MKTAEATRQLGGEPAPRGKNPKVSTSAGTLTVIPSNATSLLQAITQAASNKDVDLDKFERLFSMHKEMVAKEAEASFNAAMARAQSKIVPIANNALNTHTSSRYAKLAAINKAIVPIYTAEGLAISFDSGKSEVQDWHRTVATVSHAAGHSKSYHLDLPLDDAGSQGKVNKTKVQATGSTNSYARRYLVCMIFNVTSSDEEDDDGNGGKKQLGENIRVDYESAIEAIIDRPSGDTLWNKIAVACEKAGDVRAYADLKAKLLAKYKALGVR